MLQVPTAMVTVEIEYCVPCGLVDRAVNVQRELLEEFGRATDGVRLTGGHRDVFEGNVDGDLVFDESDHGTEFDLDAISADVKDRIAAVA